MPDKFTDMGLKELALHLTHHLQKMESQDDTGTFWYAVAEVVGQYISIRYIAYRTAVRYASNEAREYLRWLEEGNRGTHWQMERTW